MQGFLSSIGGRRKIYKYKYKKELQNQKNLNCDSSFVLSGNVQKNAWGSMWGRAQPHLKRDIQTICKRLRRAMVAWATIIWGKGVVH